MENSVYGVKSQSVSAPAGFADGASVCSLIYDRDGNRKYLTAAERHRFLDAVLSMPAELRTFCKMLAYTGARISEVLALTPRRVDLSARLVIIECLKKRRPGIFRAIPLPYPFIAELDDVHRLSMRQADLAHASHRLWPWCRAFAWRRVKEGMATAGLVGAKAMPKGLRHSFGVTSLQGQVPINMVKRWLGHARLSTTEIYLEAVGTEEQAIAERLWKTF